MVASRSSIGSHRRTVAGCRSHRRIEGTHGRPRTPSVRPEGARLFFSGQISQQVESHRLADWLGGGALIVAAASWGLLISLLGS